LPSGRAQPVRPPLPLGQNALLVSPQLTVSIATIVVLLFTIACVAFQRQAVRGPEAPGDIDS
jgi:hypothetical protein